MKRFSWLLGCLVLVSSVAFATNATNRTYTSWGWGEGYRLMETSCVFEEFLDVLSNEEMERYADENGNLRMSGLHSGMFVRLNCTDLIDSGAFKFDMNGIVMERRVAVVNNPRIVALMSRVMENNKNTDHKFAIWVATENWWVDQEVIYPVKWIQVMGGNESPYYEEFSSVSVKKLVLGVDEALLINPEPRYTMFPEDACSYPSSNFMVLLWEGGMSNQKALDALVRSFFGEPVGAIPSVSVDKVTGCNDANGLYVFVRSVEDGS